MREKDSYEFSAADRDEFIKEIEEVEAGNVWMDVKASDMSLTAFQPIEAFMLSQKHNLNADAVTDTAEQGTSLLLTVGPDGAQKVECLRDTGYYGLMQVAVGLNGPGLKRLWKRSSGLFVDSVNEFLKSNEAHMRVLYSCDKVSAVCSQSYTPMPIPELFKITEKAMAKLKGDPVFDGGRQSHAYTVCNWLMPGIKERLDMEYGPYIKSPYYNTDFEPYLKLANSNTGSSCALLLPMLKGANRAPIPLGTGIRIRHDSRKGGYRITGSGIEDFEEQANDLFPKFAESREAMQNMRATQLMYTQNAFIGACNWAFGNSLPKKWASAALEEFLDLTSSIPCTMYDVFLGICNIATEAEKANASLDRRMQIDDAISRFYSFRGDWHDFDIAGVVAWDVKAAA